MPSTPYISFILGFIKRHPNDESYILASLPKALEAFEITQGPRVMFSIPPDINKLPSPAFIALCAFIIADIPEAHNLLIVSPGTEYGSPASNKAILAIFLLSSPAWFAQPKITSLIFEGLILFLETNSFNGMAAKSSVLISFRVPPKFPKGVLIASIMYVSIFFISKFCQRKKQFL